jgi:hypothetical protein
MLRRHSLVIVFGGDVTRHLTVKTSARALGAKSGNFDGSHYQEAGHHVVRCNHRDRLYHKLRAMPLNHSALERGRHLQAYCFRIMLTCCSKKILRDAES